MIREEIKPYLTVAEAISKLLYPFAEVIIHDLKKDQIEAIFNPISNRKAGDSSYLDRVDFELKDSLPSIIGPYEKLNYDGRKLKSISIIIKNKEDLAIGFLCINLDISKFDTYQNILNIFLSNHDSSLSEKTQTVFKDDLYQQINVFVQQYCLDNHLNLETLSRVQKKHLILKLKQEGALLGKNASQYIARTLGVSRATVYNYLKEEVS
jgi:predicted transcriptional regulator YheO